MWREKYRNPGAIGIVQRLLPPAGLLLIAAKALQDIAGNTIKTEIITPDLIIEAVACNFQLTPSDIKSRKRDGVTALARQVAMYLVRQETNCSLTEAGKELGNRSPATVSYAYQKIAGDINSSPSLRRKVFEIKQSVHSKKSISD